MPTRDEFEANWGWDPKLGSIPFKRLPLTDKNIKAQAELARPGKLVHWSGKLCRRGNAKTDEYVDEKAPLIRHLGVAGHIENVNCLACRWLYFAAQRDRAARRKEAKVVKTLLAFQGGKS